MRPTERQPLLVRQAGRPPCVKGGTDANKAKLDSTSRTVISHSGSQRHWHLRRCSPCDSGTWERTMLHKSGATGGALRSRGEHRKAGQHVQGGHALLQLLPLPRVRVQLHAAAEKNLQSGLQCWRDANANMFVFELHLLGITLRTPGDTVEPRRACAALRVRWLLLHASAVPHMPALSRRPGTTLGRQLGNTPARGARW